MPFREIKILRIVTRIINKNLPEVSESPKTWPIRLLMGFEFEFLGFSVLLSAASDVPKTWLSPLS